MNTCLNTCESYCFILVLIQCLFLMMMVQKRSIVFIQAQHEPFNIPKLQYYHWYPQVTPDHIVWKTMNIHFPDIFHLSQRLN